MKVYAYPKTRAGSVNFPLGWANVDDAGMKDCKSLDPHIAIICDDQGVPVNCDIGDIPAGAKLPPDFFSHRTQPGNTEQAKPVTQLRNLSDAPEMNWTKADIHAYMDERKIEYNSGDTKSDLLEKIKWADSE